MPDTFKIRLTRKWSLSVWFMQTGVKFETYTDPTFKQVLLPFLNMFLDYDTDYQDEPFIRCSKSVRIYP